MNIIVAPCTNPSNGGTIGNAQSSAGSFNPTAITSLTLPTGQSGNLIYKWQKSVVSGSAGFTDIDNSNSSTYDPDLISQTTWFKRLARVQCMADWTNAAVSNVIQMTVGSIVDPWHECQVGNSNGSATSTGAGMFTLNSTGYSSTNSDVQESVFQNLNGNGSIIARVVDLTGGGWAGVQIRESCSPGAKKVLLKTQLQTILKAEVRQTSGGGTISTQIMRQGVKWLKLVRTANRFDEYTSVDGVAWMSAFSTTLVMNSCVQIGVFSEGLSFSRSYQARFDNVVVAGSLCAPASKSTEVEGLNENSVPDSQLSIYPNPASKTVHVEIAKTASKVTLSILSLEGKLIRSGRIENSSSQIDVSALKPGIYILRFDLDGERVTRRLVII